MLSFFVQIVYFILLQWSGSGTACRGRVYKINKSALIAAEQRIGELLLAIPKASGGINQYNKEEKADRSAKSKADVVSDLGYSRHDAQDYQQMAKNPEVV